MRILSYLYDSLKVAFYDLLPTCHIKHNLTKRKKADYLS